MSSQGMSPVFTFFFFFLPKSSQRSVNSFMDPSYRFYSACCAALSATSIALCWLFLYILLWAFRSVNANCYQAIVLVTSLLKWMTGPPHAPSAHSFLHVWLSNWLRLSPALIVFFCEKKKKENQAIYEALSAFWLFLSVCTMSGAKHACSMIGGSLQRAGDFEH